MPTSGRRASKTPTIPMAALLLLSLFWTCSALRADLMRGFLPDRLPRFERQALPLAMLALVSGLTAFARRAKWPGENQVRASILVGLGLFVLPGWLVSLSNGHITELARTALFTLVPVFALVFEPHIGSPSRANNRNRLPAALVAVVGALFIFPAAIPASLESCVVILAAACVAAANCHGVAIASHLESDSMALVAAIASTTAAIALVAASGMTEHPIWKWQIVAPELLWSAAVEMPALMLLFWLMPKLSATKMATRFLFAPLFAILIGAALLQSVQELHLRTWLGLVTMAAGAGWLLFAHEEETGATDLHLDLHG
jgi:drug/metabolite transporter (DMT)-like permease